ncbi:MAG TPA: type II toxin-antitoxin system HicB family antitoxin [Candidatus Kryptonia bacterium]|nr:type II toxin-antitoxin system HicB family antitoxin [Candidatus Kryptonia bacterium]
MRFPDLPEALTDGTDDNDAIEQATDCLDEAIAGRIRRGDVIPVPRLRRGQRRIPVSATMAAKAALYLAIREAKITKSELATRLGCHEKEVRRLLDPRHPSKLPRLQQALAQLGKRLVVEMQAA